VFWFLTNPFSLLPTGLAAGVASCVLGGFRRALRHRRNLLHLGIRRGTTVQQRSNPATHRGLRGAGAQTGSRKVQGSGAELLRRIANESGEFVFYFFGGLGCIWFAIFVSIAWLSL